MKLNHCGDDVALCLFLHVRYWLFTGTFKFKIGGGIESMSRALFEEVEVRTSVRRWHVTLMLSQHRIVQDIRCSDIMHVDMHGLWLASRTGFKSRTCSKFTSGTNQTTNANRHEIHDMLLSKSCHWMIVESKEVLQRRA